MCLKMLKYSKIDLASDRDFASVMNFVDSVSNVNVYVSDLNPITNSNVHKELKYENVSLSLIDRELKFGDGILKLFMESASEVNVYIGKKDMLITLPRGYKGAFAYYHFVDMTK